MILPELGAIGSFVLNIYQKRLDISPDSLHYNRQTERNPVAQV